MIRVEREKMKRIIEVIRGIQQNFINEIYYILENIYQLEKRDQMY